MITQEWARRFADEWIAAWNAHDLERILSHYTDDFEMSSPFIAQWAGDESGLLTGREAVARYWRDALARLPDLNFELIRVCRGVNSIAVHYKSVLGKLAIEVFFFNAEGKVIRAMAHYD